MGDGGLGVKGFDNAIVVQQILMAGASAHGERIGLEIETDAGQTTLLLIPSVFLQKLILSLLTAGGIAQQERRGLFGSYANIVAAEGFSAFRPTGHDVARVKLVTGEDVVLVRF